VTFLRYVALGDSFTEGVGDDDPARPNGVRGWADRVAEVLAGQPGADDFGYANLAIRGRKLGQIVTEQIDPALAMSPDLVTIYAGANDILRPSVDIDALAATYDEAVGRLAASGATVGIFTSFDPGSYALFKPTRGRYAIYTEHVREIADRHGCVVLDMWRTGRNAPAWAIWSQDRLHLNAVGHHYIAEMVLDTLGIPHTFRQPTLTPPRLATRREARTENVAWAREHLGPWIHRRATGRSSGDTVSPKRPELAPISPID